MSQIFELLGRMASARIMEFFLDNPTTEFYEKQVKDRTGLSKGSVNAHLNRLDNAGFLLKSKKGQMTIYRLNASSPTVRHLKVLKTVDELYSHMTRFEGVEIFLFGSCARGDNTEKSDIDILVIGKERGVINEIKKIDKKIKASFYTPLEWSLASRNDKTFFEKVERDKIRLV